jgi:hypothetical protein
VARAGGTTQPLGSLLAEDGDRPVGFVLALPDLNQVLVHLNGRLFPFGIFKALWYRRRITQTCVVVLGVVKEYRKLGIDNDERGPMNDELKKQR